MMIGPTGCDGAVSCVKRLLQDCSCGRISALLFVLSAQPRAPPCTLHHFHHNHSKPITKPPQAVPFVETHVNSQRPPIFRCISPCGGTVKCTGEGGRVLSHRYSNEEKRAHPLVVKVRSNAVHNPSKAQICTQYHNSCHYGTCQA